MEIECINFNKVIVNRRAWKLQN